MRQFVTPHMHPASFDSGSTIEQFAERELELGSGYLTITDHGTLEGVRKVYDICKTDKRFAGKLKPILGVEAYFRDDSCPILGASGAPRDPKTGYLDHIKYMHMTMHVQDEAAYRTLVRLLSRADLRAEQHGSERKPLFGWSELEELGAQNVTFCSSCLIGICGRHLLKHGDAATAKAYYERVRSLVKPGNFYVELMPHVCDKNWDEGIFIRYGDGTEEKFPSWKTLQTTEGNVKASYLADEFARALERAQDKHRELLGVMQNRKMVDLPPKAIVTVERREGFLKNECTPWATDGDVQRGVNEFVLGLARQYGDPVLISDDSHLAIEKHKIVQDVRLAQMGSWKFSNSYHRKTSAEAAAYFRDRMGISDAEIESWVENSHAWASKFDDFKFSKIKALPTNFYPEETLKHTLKLIEKTGRMDWSDPVMAARLKEEIELLYANGTVDLLPYFMVDEEVCDHYVRQGQLTGPGRGSASGVLLSYLLGITHNNPLQFGLSLHRFLTKIRIESGKMPDIDQDLPSRDLLVSPDGAKWELELDDGRKLVLSPDAPIKTTDGRTLTVAEAVKLGAEIDA